MFTRIRRRLCCDDGVSLVEMLAAIVVLSVALLGLLGAMVGGIRSVADQRDRSVATRVATEHHERLRGAGYDALVDSTATRTIDGRTFTLETDVTTVDAAPDGFVVPADAPRVKQVTTTIRWRRGTIERSAVYQTAIRPDEVAPVTAAQRIDAVSMAPNPAVVDASGRLSTAVQVTVVLSGFDDQAVVALSWTNHGGAPKTKHLVSRDGGITWTGELAAPGDAAGEVVVPAGATGLDLTVRAWALTRAHTLSLTPQGAPGPAVAELTVDPPSFTVGKKHGTCTRGVDYCNVGAVTVTASVAGVDPGRDSVRLTYTLADGTVQETAMVHDATSGRWQVTFPDGSTRFKSGTQRFTAVAVVAAADLSASAHVDCQVVRT